MYTATKLGDSVDKQTRRRTVTVLFSDGTSEFEKDFSFSIETELIAMKKIVKDYLDETNFVVPDLADGDIDFTDIPAEEVTPEPTAAELAKTEWCADLEKLKKVQELIDLGVLVGDETPVVNLKNKVKTGFKPAYIA